MEAARSAFAHGRRVTSPSGGGDAELAMATAEMDACKGGAGTSQGFYSVLVVLDGCCANSRATSTRKRSFSRCSQSSRSLLAPHTFSISP